MDQNIEKLLALPCDYDGYDIVFSEGETNPALYNRISALISNGNYDIEKLESYTSLCEDPNEDQFYEFYEEWMEDLQDEDIVVHLAMGTPIEQFANRIARSIKQHHVELDEAAVVAEYMKRLEEMGIDTVIYHDVLEANVVASMIRNLGFELIALFDGSSNEEFCVIPVDKIDEMKEIERLIKTE